MAHWHCFCPACVEDGEVGGFQLPWDLNQDPFENMGEGTRHRATKRKMKILSLYFCCVTKVVCSSFITFSEQLSHSAHINFIVTVTSHISWHIISWFLLKISIENKDQLLNCLNNVCQPWIWAPLDIRLLGESGINNKQLQTRSRKNSLPYSYLHTSQNSGNSISPWQKYIAVQDCARN